jgi:hypothetical protein
MTNGKVISKMWSFLVVIPAFLVYSCGTSNANSSEAAEKKIITDSASLSLKTDTVISKAELTAAYVSAITEYVKAAYKNDKSVFDTLFINKRPDFPQMSLPAVIEKAAIVLIQHEECLKRLKYRESLVLLNVIGWVEKEKSEFIIVTFRECGKPQHNCHLYFSNPGGMNRPGLDSLRFEYQYGKN